VILVDANVLVYAVNEDAAHHDAARSWLDEALNGADSVGFTWIALLAFLRIATSVRIFPSPLDVDTATGIVDGWLEQPSAVMVEPGAEHRHLLARLLRSTGTAANLVNDCHLAAVALERGAAVATFDADFGRFPDLRVIRPGG
jgi:uncharacterized protein